MIGILSLVGSIVIGMCLWETIVDTYYHIKHGNKGGKYYDGYED